MMRFFIDLYEEMMDAPMVLYMRRTGPYIHGNAALMTSFKSWLNARHGIFLRIGNARLFARPLKTHHGAL